MTSCTIQLVTAHQKLLKSADLPISGQRALSLDFILFEFLINFLVSENFMTNSGALYKVKFVCHSNRKIRSFSTLRVFFVSLILYLSLKVTDVIEIKAFIGLWYARGYFQ